MNNDKEIMDEVASTFLSNVRQLRQESDRGAVIVAAALIDDALQTLLQAKLCPSLENDDELFEGSYSPINSFAAKIDLAYRLGLINPEVRRSFHLIRKLRNNFAHFAYDLNFASQNVYDRVYEIFRTNEDILATQWQELHELDNPEINERLKNINSLKPYEGMIALYGLRGLFDSLISMISAYLSRLHYQVESLKPLIIPSNNKEV